MVAEVLRGYKFCLRPSATDAETTSSPFVCGNQRGYLFVFNKEQLLTCNQKYFKGHKIISRGAEVRGEPLPPHTNVQATVNMKYPRTPMDLEQLPRMFDAVQMLS